MDWAVNQLLWRTGEPAKVGGGYSSGKNTDTNQSPVVVVTTLALLSFSFVSKLIGGEKDR